MSERSCLPPAKKVRLDSDVDRSGENADTKASNATAAVNHREMEVFEWDESKILLLCCGTTRQHTKFGVKDISSVLFDYSRGLFMDYHIHNPKYSKVKYMSDGNIICDFRIPHNDVIPEIRSHELSAVFLTPFISDIMKVNQSCQLKAVITKCDCAIDASKTGKKWETFTIGFIGVPKGSVADLNAAVDVLRNKLLSDENLANECHGMMLHWDEFKYLNKSKRSRNEMWRLNMMTYQQIVEDKSNSLFLCFDESRFGSSLRAKKINKVTQMSISIEKERQWIDKVEFKANGHVMFSKYGSVLDFDYYDYLFAVSCVRCGCPKSCNVDGYQLKVCVEDSVMN